MKESLVFVCLIIEQMLTVEMCAITKDYYHCLVPTLFKLK